MKEDLLHYVWRIGKFDMADLRATDGQAITILARGQHNADGGPDFLDARLRIGDTVWAGNVEMHLKASDWERHGHSADDAYQNVILHVVWEEDVPICRPSGARIPCLELRRRIPKHLQTQYLRLLHSEKRIPCEGLQEGAPKGVWRMWLERLIVERIEEKLQPIRRAMQLQEQHREEVFYQFLARNFGLRVNAEPFERLARSLPQVILSKHRNDRFQLEALLFGQAGMLSRSFKDEYPRRLKAEYDFLRKKYGLTPIRASEWKFLRLRPANFPTLRIAQFAALVQRSSRLFSELLEVRSFEELSDFFEVGVSDYWMDHYVFDKPSVHRPKNLGKTLVQLISINTVVPFLFHYGQDKGNTAYVDRALALLSDLDAEKNKIISIWKELGLSPEHAGHSQALLHLYKNYCNAHRCLECRVGHRIMGKAQPAKKVAAGTKR